METLYSENSFNLFYNPAKIIIAGYSNSGKTEMCSRIIEKYYNKLTLYYIAVLFHICYRITK